MRVVDLVCTNNNDKLEFNSKAGTKYTKSMITNLSKYLNNLNNLKENIIKSKNPDVFLSYYNNTSCDLCNNEQAHCKISSTLADPENAHLKLLTFQNGIFNDVITEFTKLGFDILIAGSSGIASVMKKTNTFKGFEPKDMDVYIKCISDNKIKAFDIAVRKAFPNDNVIIIRRPLTLTWWIYDRFDNYKAEIQLNILYVRSWSDVFVVYHSDAVCVGYDVRLKKFVTLTERWNNFIHSYPIIWLTNLNSSQSSEILDSSAKKYSERGFSCYIINVIKDNNNTKENDVIISGGLYSGNENKSIYDKLISTYKKCQDIAINDTIDHLYEKSVFPQYIKIDTLNNNDPFVKRVLNLEYPGGLECPIIMETYSIAVANKNCKHEVSLKAYLFINKFSECPICRVHFEPIIYNSLTGKHNTSFNKKKSIITQHKFVSKGIINGEEKSTTHCNPFSYDLDYMSTNYCSCKECTENNMSNNKFDDDDSINNINNINNNNFPKIEEIE